MIYQWYPEYMGGNAANREFLTRDPYFLMWVDDENNPNIWATGTVYNEKDTQVEDGVCHINIEWKKLPKPDGNYYYKYRKGGFDGSGSWYPYASMGKRRPVAEPYWINIDRKMLFEYKCKVPKSMMGWEVWLGTENKWMDPHDGLDDIRKPEFRNAKGVAFNEIDFFELTTTGRNTNNHNICPRGGWIHSTFGDEEPSSYGMNKYDNIKEWQKEFNTYGFSYRLGPKEIWFPEAKFSLGDKTVDEWCEEWHILQVELSPTSMTTYIDGNVAQRVSWEKSLDPIPPNQKWQLKIQPENYEKAFENPRPDYDKGVKYDFQLDYVKVYKEIN